MSTGLNSMTGVILIDFIRPLCKKPLSEAQASFYMKIMVVVLGCVFVALAFAVDQLGGLIQVNFLFFFFQGQIDSLSMFSDFGESFRHHSWDSPRNFHVRNVVSLG